MKIFWVAAITTVSEIKKHITVSLPLVMNKEIVWIKINNKTRKVYKIKNGSGSYRLVRFPLVNNYSLWYGVSSDMKISKFERILRRDSTLHIDKTFQ